MVKSITKRLLAVALVLAVALLATHAVSHWHPHAYDEAHCRVCHIGQAAIPQAAAQVAVQAPAPIAQARARSQNQLPILILQAPSASRALLRPKSFLPK